MVCKFCGNTIEDNSEFCFICGNKAIKDEIPAEEVFTQPKPAEVPVVTAEAPAVDAQTVYTQQAPVYAQHTPIFAQQVYVQQTVAPKKAKKKAPKSSCSKALKIFAIIFRRISYKAGEALSFNSSLFFIAKLILSSKYLLGYKVSKRKSIAVCCIPEQFSRQSFNERITLRVSQTSKSSIRVKTPPD